MNFKKILFLIFILLTTIILVSCGGNDMLLEKELNNFSKLIEKENLNDVSLTIYYIEPFILTRAPLSIDDLINFSGVEKIAINGSDLEEHIDLFKQISKDDLILVKNKSSINTRFYYVFETEKEGKIFDVAMWGDDSSVFVNGLEVKGNNIFYDIIFPFLSDEALKDLDTYLGR